MFRSRKVTPRMIGVAVFSVALAFGLTALFVTRPSREAGTVSAAPTTALQQEFEPGMFGEGPVADPGLPSDVTNPDGTPAEESPDGTPPVTNPDGTPWVDPDVPLVPASDEPLPEGVQGEYTDPGADPVEAPNRFTNEMSLGWPGGAMWTYVGSGTMEDLVAHYGGALNSGTWTMKEVRPKFNNPQGTGTPEAWVMTATSPAADATVDIWTNRIGGVQSQVTLSYHT